ncbi:MAG: 16S rRNA m(3)U-1498 methyltransferase [Magnetococcales bacterium]|nr:16S rRNA m(3)U-1498 methyltransferase [Magnetococcales bacterium]HIJ85216.1 16S rRNA (uracil(1498)-N(3))-methyltransferase [Magnetococcales bacterium]
MKPRLYIKANLENGAQIILDSESRHYLIHTLRRKPGSNVLLFNGSTPEFEWEATLVATHPEAHLQVQAAIPVTRESTLRVTLAVGLIKGDAMEWIIQKAVELGVFSLIPLQTQRTVVRISQERWPAKERRWSKIIQEAAEQCQRVRLMHLYPPTELSHLQPLLPTGPRYLFWEQNQEGLPRLGSMSPPGPEITLLTGPEGGFSAQEVQLAKDRFDFKTLTLGPRILRAETAALAAVTAVQTLWGDLG